MTRVERQHLLHSLKAMSLRPPTLDEWQHSIYFAPSEHSAVWIDAPLGDVEACRCNQMSEVVSTSPLQRFGEGLCPARFGSCLAADNRSAWEAQVQMQSFRGTARQDVDVPVDVPGVEAAQVPFVPLGKVAHVLT